MNAAQAKKVPLYDLLSSLGFTPADTRKSGNEVWYQSPFRSEKEPSFKIKIDQNVWYDFGEGEGGNILDFVMKYNNCGFNEALHFLGDKPLKPSLLPNNSSFQKKQQTLEMFDIEAPLITEIKPVFHFALKKYLKERGITSEIGFKHLKEIHYEVEGKSYFGLGFKNDSGGWEMRNKLFKGCLGKKDITLIEAGATKVSAFEGFMDYLSYLTLHGNIEDSDAIILNSTSMKGAAVRKIQAKGYGKVETYFDNDKGGNKTLEYFWNELPVPEITILNKNHLYEPYKDFNDYLVQKMAQHAK